MARPPKPSPRFADGGAVDDPDLHRLTGPAEYGTGARLSIRRPDATNLRPPPEPPRQERRPYTLDPSEIDPSNPRGPRARLGPFKAGGRVGRTAKQKNRS